MNCSAPTAIHGAIWYTTERMACIVKTAISQGEGNHEILEYFADPAALLTGVGALAHCTDGQDEICIFWTADCDSRSDS